MILSNKIIKKSILFIIVILAGISKIYSQETKKKEAQANAHMVSYETKLKELDILAYPKHFYDCKIDINKYNDLKDAGVDLVELGKKSGGYDYKEYCMLSSCIVKGKVISKEYHENNNNYFHTSYKFLVEKCLKSDYKLPETITIKTVSGPIENNRSVQTDVEPRLFLGEEVLVMLFNVSDEILNFDSSGYYIINADKSDYMIYEKFYQKSDIYIDSEKEIVGKASEIEKVITNLVKINKSDNFKNIKF